MKTRIERDTLGEIHVQADRFWGAQTQRSLENFRIGQERIPSEVIAAFAHLKKSGGHRKRFPFRTRVRKSRSDHLRSRSCAV